MSNLADDETSILDATLVQSTCVPATRRGDDALAGVVIDHLLRALPLSFEHGKEPRPGVMERVQQLQTVMQDVGMVGLYGMGGIGKSTLAEAFFVEQSKSFQLRVLLHVGQEARHGELRDR